MNDTKASVVSKWELKISQKKAKNAYRYKIQIALNRKFTNNRKKFTTFSSISITVAKLKKGKDKDRLCGEKRN